MEIPVYLFTGFLESGKTTFISEVLNDESFSQGERTLVLLCEEGEMEIDPAILQAANAVTAVIESREEMTAENLDKLAKAAKADRVMIEWNGMWPIADLANEALPENWMVYQVVTTICGATYMPYSNNMGGQMFEHIANADLVVINRASETDKEQIREKKIHAINPRATIFFEDENGDAEEYTKGMEAFFDLDVPVIEISNEDFGLWYIDAMNNPQKYEGKTVKITGMVFKGKDFDSQTFVPGRFAMVCCADDVTFIGFVCKTPKAASLKPETWVTVTAEIKAEFYPQYRGEGPVLYATEIVSTEKPEPDMVFFN